MWCRDGDKEMIEDNTVYLPPESIIIKDDLPRFREEMGDVKGLIASLKKHGQFHPILINRKNELIAGGRRLLACRDGKIDIKCTYSDVVDEFTMREIELEENVQRKDLTPAEEVMAIKELHTIKQKVHGVATSGKVGGWTLDDTAALIGKTRGSVIESIELANTIETFPEFKSAGSKSDIKKGMKAIINVVAAVKANAAHDEFIATGNNNEQVKMFCKDMTDHMQSMEDSSVDLLLADLPYGIEIHDIALGLGGKTGNKTTTTGTTYDDSTAIALNLHRFLAVESFRVCKHDAHGFLFTSPEHFYTIREWYKHAGWICYIKPIIWVKGNSGQTNMPSHWPSSCYEMILYIRKDNSRLILEGRPDWIQCDPVRGREKIHQAEKPVALLKELMMRTCLANAVVFDPCGGSGSTMQAAIELKMQGIYCDDSKENYSLAAERIKQCLK